jgi:hypothetical protein
MTTVEAGIKVFLGACGSNMDYAHGVALRLGILVLHVRMRTRTCMNVEGDDLGLRGSKRTKKRLAVNSHSSGCE